jgi:membrane dipeptidase
VDLSPSVPIFDGHNDVLSRLLEDSPVGDSRPFFERSTHGHIDLPRAREGGFAGGLFSVYIPGDAGLPVELGHAQQVALQQIGLLYRLQREASGALTVVRTASDLHGALDAGVLAAVIHMEGAEPIDPRLHVLEVFYQAGLRTLGPVWSRPNAFGEGVPYRFPHSPDTGPGLTDEGFALVRACNELGIALDVSHINEQGFWDIARTSRAPLIASHSNAHALTPSTRNLTDRQLDAIRDSGGIVGVNFYTGFLRPDGERNEDTPISLIVDHVRYLVDRMGAEHVGFGADLDGALIPREVGDVAGLPKVIAALRESGYDEPTLRSLGYQNWLRVLSGTWS